MGVSGQYMHAQSNTLDMSDIGYKKAFWKKVLWTFYST